MDAKLRDQLFVLADEDRDGAITGGEAVKFFARSALPQEVLGQVSEDNTAF
jgi:epidermal growth factor receptor substrate 15